MKIKFTLSIGLVGGRNDEIEYDDNCMDGMSEEEKEIWLSTEWQEWAWQYIDGGATIVEE